MNKKVLGIFLIVCLTLLSACGEKESESSLPPLNIVGDINKEFAVDKAQIPLSDIVEQGDINGTPDAIHFIAYDGFSAVIDAKDADKCTLEYNEDQGWTISAPEHPPSANAKDLETIVIVANDSTSGLAVKDGETTSYINMGNLYTGPLTYFPIREGASESSEASTEVVTRERGFFLKDILATYNNEPIVLFTESGDKFLSDGNGYFSLNKNKINFRESNGELYENIKEIEIRK